MIFLTSVEEQQAKRPVPESLKARRLTKSLDVTLLVSALHEFLPPLGPQ